jgi:hypothetical protein
VYSLRVGRDFTKEECFHTKCVELKCGNISSNYWIEIVAKCNECPTIISHLHLNSIFMTRVLVLIHLVKSIVGLNWVGF